MDDVTKMPKPSAQAAVVANSPESTALALSLIKRHALSLSKKWMLVLALIASSVFLFSSLESKSLWIDESINAVLGENILSFGYPVKWDGTYLEEPYFNIEASRGLVEIQHCWLQYYLTAASLEILGRNTVAARLPFAALGILSVLALYFLALRISGSELVAGLSALLISLHTGFLLYSRLCRYFSPTFLLMILLPLQYLRWVQRPGRGNLFLLTLLSVLLFYTHYPIWPFLICSMWLHFLVFEAKHEDAKKRIRALAISTAASSVLALPWVFYAKPYEHNIPDWSGATYVMRLSMFAWKLNTWVFPWFGLALIAGLAWFVNRIRGNGGFVSRGELRGEYLLLVSVPLYLVLVILARHPMFSSQYTALAIPFAVLVCAQILVWIRRSSKLIGAVALALLIGTNVLQASPFIIVDKLGLDSKRIEPLMINPQAQFNSPAPLDYYIHEELSLRSPIFEYVYFITHDYSHRLKGVVNYLRANVRPGDTVLAPWHDADAIRFYTGANVVYHFKPTFTVDWIKRLVYKPGTRIDWIVPNAFYEPKSPFFTYDPRDYERVYINCPKDYIYENEPNLDFFTWRTNTDAPSRFFILKRKESASGPISINIKGPPTTADRGFKVGLVNAGDSEEEGP